MWIWNNIIYLIFLVRSSKALARDDSLQQPELKANFGKIDGKQLLQKQACPESQFQSNGMDGTNSQGYDALQPRAEGSIKDQDLIKKCLNITRNGDQVFAARSSEALCTPFDQNNEIHGKLGTVRLLNCVFPNKTSVIRPMPNDGDPRNTINQSVHPYPHSGSHAGLPMHPVPAVYLGPDMLPHVNLGPVLYPGHPMLLGYYPGFPPPSIKKKTKKKGK